MMTDLVRPVGMNDNMLREMYKAAIRRYYRSHNIPIFFNIERKEFGVGDFGKKIVRRYVTFRDSGDFKGYLLHETPLYISYSVADWEHPEERNDTERGFLGAELVYEFDDDEFVRYAPADIACCPRCNDFKTVGELIEKGLNPLYCVNCGERREMISLPSESRWKRVVQETKRLVEILVEDLGVPEQYIHFNYSGNRGIHIHVTDNRFTDAKVMFPHHRNKYNIMKEMHRVRQELTEYFTLAGFNAEHIDFRYDAGKVLGPTTSYGGMVGRIVRYIHHKLMSNNSPYVFHKYISNDAERKAMENLLKIVGNNQMAKRIEIGVYDGGVGNTTLLRAWRSVFDGVAKEIAIPIDAQTSADIKRLIRMPNTIHGTTGLVARTIKYKDLDKFNPYEDAVALPNSPKMTLWIKYLPEVAFNGKKFGPYQEEEVDLPLNFAFFLLGIFGYWNNNAEGGGNGEEAK